MGNESGARRLHAFRSLAGNRALLRVLGGYALFTLNEYAVWIAMLVYAYSRGGATIAGLVALAQLAPAAVAGPGGGDARGPPVTGDPAGRGLPGAGGGDGRDRRSGHRRRRPWRPMRPPWWRPPR